MQKITMLDSKTLRIPLGRIDLSKLNPKRLNLDNPKHRLAYEQTRDSMKERGQLEPVLGTPFKMVKRKLHMGRSAMKGQFRVLVVNGEKRVTASRELGWPDVEVKLVLDHIDMKWVQEAQFITGAKGISVQDYDGVEIARSFKSYIDDNFAEDESAGIAQVARFTGYSSNFVYGRLAILRAPEKLQELISAGKIGNNFVFEAERAANSSQFGPKLLDYIYEQALRTYKDSGAFEGSVLDSRPVKKQIAKLETMASEQKWDGEKLFEAEKTVVRLHGRSPSEKLSGKAYIEDYIIQLELWYSEVSKWTLVGVSEKDILKLASKFENLHSLFRNLEKEALGGKIDRQRNRKFA